MREAIAWFQGWTVTRKGGPGSGNWGHAGRKGQRGGSMPHTAAMSLRTGETAQERQEYAKTGEKSAALIRKEILQETRKLEAREAELRAKSNMYLSEAMAYTDNVVGPINKARVAILNQYGIEGKKRQDYQELHAQYEQASTERAKIWEKQYRVNEEIMEVLTQKRQLARNALVSDTPADVSLNFGKLRKASRPPVQEGRQIFSDLIEDRSSIHGRTVDVRRPTYYGPNRAYYQHGAIHMPAKTSARTTVHEMGHWMEEMDPDVHRRAVAFLERRTAGQAPIRLKDYYAGINASYAKSFEDHEIGVKDNFMDIYMGKDYGGRATEIISMGLEYLAFNASDFAKQDPEYFDFMVDIVRGR